MFSLGLYTHVGHSCHFLLHGEELSTIPLSLRTIFYERIRLRSLFDYLFAITFILCRVIYGTVICWYVLEAVPVFLQMASDNHDTTSIVFCWIQVLLFILTRVLNLYWSTTICRKAWAKIPNDKGSIVAKNEDYAKKNC